VTDATYTIQNNQCGDPCGQELTVPAISTAYDGVLNCYGGVGTVDTMVATDSDNPFFVINPVNCTTGNPDAINPEYMACFLGENYEPNCNTDLVVNNCYEYDTFSNEYSDYAVTTCNGGCTNQAYSPGIGDVIVYDCSFYANAEYLIGGPDSYYARVYRGGCLNDGSGTTSSSSSSNSVDPALPIYIGLVLFVCIVGLCCWKSCSKPKRDEKLLNVEIPSSSV